MEIVSVRELLYAWVYQGRLNVYRSPVAVEHGETFQPVREYIEQHGLVRTSSKCIPDPDMAFQQALLEEYDHA